MRRLLYLVLPLLILLVSKQVHAVRATVSVSTFYKKDTKQKDASNFDANILFSWRVDNTSLKIEKNSKGNYQVLLHGAFRISNTDTTIIEDEFNVELAPRQSWGDVFEQFTSDQLSYKVPPGRYDIEFVIMQKGYPQELFSYTDSLIIQPLPKNNVSLSSIQLLDTVLITNNEPSTFIRNKQLDIPLSSNYYDEYRNVVHAYTEQYPSLETSEYKGIAIRYAFISWRSFGVPITDILTFKDTITTTDRNVRHKYYDFDISALGSGNYYLNVILKDTNDMPLDKKNIFFQRYSPTQDSILKLKPQVDTVETLVKKAEDSTHVDHILDLTNTFVGKFTASQVRSVLKMLLLISEPHESLSINSFLSKPDELYSKYFIYNFWEKRDAKNPAAAWKAYANKIIEVNKIFKSGTKSGFETDRGRIYILYGKPNDRIIVNNENGALPYEIWQYYATEKDNREGLFLFYKSGRTLNDYELLHSTVLGERRNTNWRMFLYKTNTVSDGSSTTSNSQAEQYIGNK